MAVRMYLWQAVLAISMWKRVLANEKRELGLNLYGGGYENYSLAHVNATGPDDVLHYLWGASRGGVSLVIVLTKLDTEVNIRWNANGTEGVMSDIKFSEDPLLSFGIIVPLVMQYKDIKDTANIGTVSDDDVTVYDMRDIQWRGTVRSNDPDSVVLRFVGTNFFQKNLTSGHPLKEDSLVFQISISSTNGRGESLPHLAHTENCSEIQVLLQRLDLPSMTNYSRFAFPVKIVSSDNSRANNDGFFQDDHASLDDEFSPGVFELLKVMSSNIMKSLPGSFLIWRPIAYLTNARDFNDATAVKVSQLKDVDSMGSHDLDSVLGAVFGNRTLAVKMQAMNVSFGLPEDGFFFGTNYTVWNLVVGLGLPPKDNFSPLIISAIIVVVTAPIAIGISGVVCLAVKRISGRMRPETSVIRS